MQTTLESFKKDARKGVLSCNEKEVEKICEGFFRYRLNKMEKYVESLQSLFEGLLQNNLIYSNPDERIEYAVYSGVSTEDIEEFALSLIDDYALCEIISLLYEREGEREEKEEEEMNYLRAMFKTKLLSKLHTDY